MSAISARSRMRRRPESITEATDNWSIRYSPTCTRRRVSAKLKALLAIADKVRAMDGWSRRRTLTGPALEGADDKAIHDTVLIAAAFCMFNRYVDGLGTWAPKDPAAYEESGLRLANQGYVRYDFSKP